MGTYVYKVTAKTVMLTDGTKANVAMFAYKPGWGVAENAKMAFRSGCAAAERFVQGKNYTGKIVLGGIDEATGKLYVGSTVAWKCDYGTFEDHMTERFEVVGVPVNMPVGTKVAIVD